MTEIDEMKFSFHPFVERAEELLRNAKEWMVEFKTNERDKKPPTKEFKSEHCDITSDIVLIHVEIEKMLLREVVISKQTWIGLMTKLMSTKTQLQTMMDSIK